MIDHLPAFAKNSPRLYRRIGLACACLSLAGMDPGFAAESTPFRPDAGTVLLLHFDGNPDDATAGGRNCRLDAPVFVSDGVFGQALGLDGTQQGTIAIQGVPDLSSGFTVEAWLRLPRPDDSRFGKVLELPGCFSWGMNTYSRGRAKIDFSVNTGGGGGTMKTIEYVPCGVWVHVACTYNPAAEGAARLSLFVNGTPTDTLTKYQTRTAPEGALNSTPADLVLGRNFVGDIDELRFSVPPRAEADLGGCWRSGVSGVFGLKAMSWTLLPPPPAGQAPGSLRFTEAVAVPTFTAIGIRLKADQPLPETGVSATVRYRAAGGEWRQGMNLTTAPHDPELRGSLIELNAGTAYEIEVTPSLENNVCPVIRLNAQTWPEMIPVGRTVTLAPDALKGALTIGTNGAPDAWVRYAPPAGREVTIDGGNTGHAAVTIRGASYVIFERFHVRGGSRHGIEIMDSHHIRIRGCDISGWGRVGALGEDGIRRTETGERINIDAGVLVGSGSRQIVVEHNLMHAQRSSANSWEFGHPLGPQGVVIANSEGNHVIRYNDMIGSETHWWNDAIESVSNGAVTGGPYRDTDIYGNILFFANDDGTELDGGQINVRYHHNWVEKTLCGVSCAPCISGPSYVFRNVFAHLGDERGRAGSAFKMGGGARYSPGLNIIFHNTVYGRAGGLCSVGFGENNSAEERGGYHAFACNNLFAGPARTARDVTDKSLVPVSHFDYDLLGRGGALVPPGNELHAVRRSPTFRGEALGDYRLTADSAGVDAGIHIPGMNDRFAGSAPDMGALETDAGEAFPPRPHGLTVSPPRLVATRFLGSRNGTDAEIVLLAPETAGTSWEAIPNSDWLQCEPAGGTCSGIPVRIRIRWNLEAAAPVSPRRAAVTFRTDLGFLRTLPVDIHVYHDPVEIILEAESGELTGEMVIGPATDAAGGAFVHVPIPDQPVAGEARTRPRGSVILNVNVPKEGTYYLAGRALAPEPSELHDSFFAAWDDSEPVRWDVRVKADWDWTLLDQGWTLTSGMHRLTILSREMGTCLDRVLISNNRVPGPLSEKR